MRALLKSLLSEMRLSALTSSTCSVVSVQADPSSHHFPLQSQRNGPRLTQNQDIYPAT